MSKHKLEAYYYAFDPTGNDAIDAILAAVARAGKAFHHTEDWCNDTSDGSAVGWIQDAANAAALSTPTARCPHIVSSDEGTQYCALAERMGPPPASSPENAPEPYAWVCEFNDQCDIVFGPTRPARWPEHACYPLYRRAALPASGERAPDERPDIEYELLRGMQELANAVIGMRFSPESDRCAREAEAHFANAIMKVLPTDYGERAPADGGLPWTMECPHCRKLYFAAPEDLPPAATPQEGATDA